MRNLNLDQLQTLIAIADLGTLAAAAQALHLAPPTVSLHVSELESRLGTALLVRGRRQSMLTTAGQALVDGGRRLLTDSDQLLAGVRRRAEGRDRPVRVAATAGISVQLLPQVLAALGAASPGVAIKLDLLSSANAMARLRDAALELAIVALPQARSAEVHVSRWRSDPMVRPRRPQPTTQHGGQSPARAVEPGAGGARRGAAADGGPRRRLAARRHPGTTAAAGADTAVGLGLPRRIALRRVGAGGVARAQAVWQCRDRRTAGTPRCRPTMKKGPDSRRALRVANASRQAARTSMRRGCACACFGMRSVSKPSFRLASTFDASSSRLSVKVRR